MTTDELAMAEDAKTLREEIDELVRSLGVQFVDRSPVIGAINPIAIPMDVTTETQADGTVVVVGRVTFGAAYEGAPGCVHGGFVAAYFDEVLGVAQAMTPTPGMTANLTINYRSPTPLLKPLVFRATATKVEGRKIFTSATLHHEDTLCAEATGLFVAMKPEVMELLMKQREENY
jgi:acyl-coenzyme A thioesterase PaaI-like protein